MSFLWSWIMWEFDGTSLSDESLEDSWATAVPLHCYITQYMYIQQKWGGNCLLLHCWHVWCCHSSDESLLTAYTSEWAAEPPPFPGDFKRHYPAVEAAQRSHLPVLSSLLLQRHLSGPDKNEFTPWCLLEPFCQFFSIKSCSTVTSLNAERKRAASKDISDLWHQEESHGRC